MGGGSSKLVCQQCGEEWVGSDEVRVSSCCSQWSKGITREQFDRIDRLLAENVERASREASDSEEIHK